METNIDYRALVSMDYDKSAESTPWMVKQNVDTLTPLTNWRFESVEECMLAIALWLVILKYNDRNNVNDLRYLLKHTLLASGANTIWTK